MPRVRARTPIDPYNIYACAENWQDKRALRLAFFVAVSFHFLLFQFRFSTNGPAFKPQEIIKAIEIVALSRASGANNEGASKPPIARRVTSAQPLPFPDPTPDLPDPLQESVTEVAPEIVSQISGNVGIGPVEAPGDRRENGHKGKTPGNGSPAGVTGDVRFPDRDTVPPVPIVQVLPPYTEDARRARVEGLVQLQVVIRKNGTVDSIRIIRGLGHGLDESAINTVANKWRFKPGTRFGEPVDVLAHIEIFFRLF